MADHGRSWQVMTCHDRSWHAMAGHAMSWQVMADHGLHCSASHTHPCRHVYMHVTTTYYVHTSSVYIVYRSLRRKAVQKAAYRPDPCNQPGQPWRLDTGWSRILLAGVVIYILTSCVFFILLFHASKQPVRLIFKSVRIVPDAILAEGFVFKIFIQRSTIGSVVAAASRMQRRPTCFWRCIKIKYLWKVGFVL